MTDTAVLAEQIKARLAGYERRFNTVFEDYFRTLGSRFDAPSLSRFTPQCLNLLRDMSLLGGKRLRAAFIYEAARLVTAEPIAGLDDAALSIELLQTHGLVHDDIIDDSPTRRGSPSVYYSYREMFPADPQAALGLAVLAGDLALALSVQVLLDSAVPLPVRHSMVEVQVAAASAAIVGQITDIERDFTDIPSEELLHSVSDYKTAHYSVLAPLQFGLLAAGEQPARFAEELRRYARLVGICGQMRDDYLDLFGDAATMGKPTGTDIRDGKHSYTVRALLTTATGSDLAVVKSALGDPACSAQTITAIQEIARSSGAEQKLRTDMRRYAELACVEAAGWRPRWREEAVTFFERFPMWSVERVL